MDNGIVRPLRDGGCSICYASDENVGKRRCKHTLGKTAPSTKVKNVTFIDCSAIVDDGSIKDKTKMITSYFNTLSKCLPKNKKLELVAAYRSAS